MRRSTSRWRDKAASRLRNGLNPEGRCGSPARKAACAGVNIEARTIEVRAARALDAVDLVAVAREVQVHREQLTFAEAVLEPHAR